MLRGKYESPCEVVNTQITVGEVLVIERDGKWYCAKDPTQEVPVEVIDWEDLKD